METKEIEVRLEVIKLLVTIGDKAGIAQQAEALKKFNDPQLDEIITLLEGNNYRQALYLIKNYKLEHFASNSLLELDEPQEIVLGVEDMLRMSPLAQETINEYRAQAYTKEDLDKFSQTIMKTNEESYQEKKRDVVKETEEIQKVSSKEEEIDTLVKNADQDIPLDEISANVIKKSEKTNRSKVLSKYKTLREKFARKEKEEATQVTKDRDKSELKISRVAEDILKQSKDSVKESFNKKEDGNKEEEIIFKKEEVQEKKEIAASAKEESNVKKSRKETKKREENTIYPPIPHIEEKFRRFFTLYPPIKESDVWVEVVIKFLKKISKESYTEQDVAAFLDEFDYFVKRGDIARASQVILLAGATDSKLAQFRLARELFSGKVMQRNIKASFEIIKRLAEDFYPEAVCDLAQFYEYGLGVPKDKKVALKLYEKAFELGSVRASKHINRLKEASGGLLLSLLKLH